MFDEESIDLQQIAPLLVGLRDLPKDWDGDRWQDTCTALHLQVKKRRAADAVFTFPGDIHLSAYWEEGLLVLLQVYLWVYYMPDDYSENADDTYDRLEAKWKAALDWATHSLGPCNFSGESNDEQISGTLRNPGDYLALWNLEHARLYITAQDSMGDLGPWVVELDVEPIRKQVQI